MGKGKRKPGPFPFPRSQDPHPDLVGPRHWAQVVIPTFRPISCPFPCLVSFCGPLPYFLYPTPGSESRPCSTTPTTATWRMPFPTTSCDLSPVTGTTPGAGSAGGVARGRLGCGSPVLGGRVYWGWWLHSLLASSGKAPSEGEAVFPPISRDPPSLLESWIPPWKKPGLAWWAGPLGSNHDSNRHQQWGLGQMDKSLES